jgi:SAM-dependent methyltransferase
MFFFSQVLNLFRREFSGRILDIGALDINGGPHTLLQCEKYVGVDVSEGPNVNLVSRGEDLDLPSSFFDVSMSSECFEHNPSWRATFTNMVRMTRPLGLVVFSCATIGRAEHGTSRSDGGFAAPLAVEQGYEYYGNISKREFLEILEKHQFLSYSLWQNFAVNDLYFVGIKSSLAATTADMKTASNKLAELHMVMRRYIRSYHLKLPLTYIYRYVYEPVYKLFFGRRAR